jgi:hypothetical protein
MGHLERLCSTKTEEAMVGTSRVPPARSITCSSMATGTEADGSERIALRVLAGPLHGLTMHAVRDANGVIRSQGVSGPPVARLTAEQRTMLDEMIGQFLGAIPPFRPGQYSQGQVVTFETQPLPTATGLRTGAQQSTCTVTGRGEISAREVLALSCDTTGSIDSSAHGATVWLRGEVRTGTHLLIETGTGATRRGRSVTALVGTATDPARGTTIPVTVTVTLAVSID